MANQSIPALNAWFDTPLGMRVLEQERDPLREIVRQAHGDVLLWLGCSQSIEPVLRGSLVRHRIYGSAQSGRLPASVPSIRCEYEALPLAPNSVDAVVLHHALESAIDPRNVLREAARVVAPGGRLVLCTFNPLSLWGCRWALAQVFADPFSGLRLRTSFRLRDWLAVLGFELGADPVYVHYGLPLESRNESPRSNSLQQFFTGRRLPFGGVCILTATKRTAATIRPITLPTRQRTPLGYGKPVFGSSNVIPLSRTRTPISD